jgi:hypothetical protein
MHPRLRDLFALAVAQLLVFGVTAAIYYIAGQPPPLVVTTTMFRE